MSAGGGRTGGRSTARRRAVLALGLMMAVPSVARARGPRAAVDVAVAARAPIAVDGGSVSRLAELLAARLGQEGFEVVSVGAAPDIIVSLSLGSPDCLLRAALPTGDVARNVPACGARTADDRLELVQKATELVRSAYHPDGAAPLAAPPLERPSEPVIVTAGAPVVRDSAPREISAGIDLRVRALRIDPVARVGGRVRLDAQWALELVTALTQGAGAGVVVTEADLLIGFGRRLHGSDRLRVEATASVGWLVHHFDAASGSGTNLDVLGVVALSAMRRLSRHLAVDLRIAPGLSRTAYEHVGVNGDVWSVSRPRIDVGAGLVLF